MPVYFSSNSCLCVFTVLSLHKRPVTGNADISFPKKGWMGMEDWARNSEDKVTISKSIVSSGNPGDYSYLGIFYTTHTRHTDVYMATTLRSSRVFSHLACILQPEPRTYSGLILGRGSKSQVCFHIKEFLLNWPLMHNSIPHFWVCRLAQLETLGSSIYCFALFSFGANT